MKKLMMAALAALPLFCVAQTSISGKVNTNQNEPLVGATIKVENSNLSTLTNADGTFVLNNLKNGTYTIVASYVGYEKQQKTININKHQTINFNLNALVFMANEVIISGTRASTNSATTFKNIDKETIEKNNFGQDLPFILDNTPSVVVTSDAGAGVGYTGIRIRGSDATRVNVTINGIPLNDSESQGTFWVNMPDFASSVDNIQIQRGVGTSTNGAGAFGGSLNIQTTGSEDSYAELNNTFGSFNTLKNTVKVGTGLIDSLWSFDARLSRIKSDGFVDRASSNLKSYFVSGAYHGKKELLRINIFSGTEKTYQAWNGVPEAKLNGDVKGIEDYISRNWLSEDDAKNLLNSGNRTYNSYTYHDQTDNYTQNHYQALYAKQFNSKINLNLALHYTKGAGYFEEYKNDQKLKNYGLENVVIKDSIIKTTNLIRRRWLDNHFYGFTYNVNFLANSQLNFSLGGAYNEYDGKHFGQVIWAQYASNSANDRHYYDGKGFKTDFNSFGKINYLPNEKLSLFADLQYRQVNYTISGMDKNLTILDIKDKLHFFNPKVGATYFINPYQNIYASFSVANKEPSRDDYVNNEAGKLPKSEKLNDLELGYRYKKSKLNVGINTYGMFYKDQLVITGKVSDVGEYYRQNVVDSYRIGLEIDGAYIINQHFSINANATFSSNKIKEFTEYIDDYDNGGQKQIVHQNKSISFSPNTIIGAEIAYSPIKKFAIALQNKYVGKQYLDNTQSENKKLNSYLVQNLRIGYNLSLKHIKNINISLLANNILNEKYESNGYTFGYLSGGNLTTENFYYPQSGTNLMLNLNFKF